MGSTSEPVKNKQKPSKKFTEKTRNDDWTTGSLLDYLYHQKYYKRTGIDLSRQTNKNIPQKINCTGNLKEDDGGKMFCIAGKRQNTILNIGLN